MSNPINVTIEIKPVECSQRFAGVANIDPTPWSYAVKTDNFGIQGRASFKFMAKIKASLNSAFFIREAKKLARSKQRVARLKANN